MNQQQMQYKMEEQAAYSICQIGTQPNQPLLLVNIVQVMQLKKTLKQGTQVILDIAETIQKIWCSKRIRNRYKNALACQCRWEYTLRVKLYKLLESRKVVLQWILAHCGTNGNEKSDKLAKRGASMYQKNLNITHTKKGDNYQVIIYFESRGYMMALTN